MVNELNKCDFLLNWKYYIVFYNNKNGRKKLNEYKSNSERVSYASEGLQRIDGSKQWEIEQQFHYFPGSWESVWMVLHCVQSQEFSVWRWFLPWQIGFEGLSISAS